MSADKGERAVARQQRAQVERRGFQRELARLDLREVEDVADDGGERLRAVADLVEVVAPALLVEPGFACQAGEADHAVQRCAQFVAHRR